jgi:prefoldin subunit 4
VSPKKSHPWGEVLLKPRRYKIGDSFFSLPVSEVQEHLSTSVDHINEEVTSTEEKLSVLREEMQELKTALYGRFGRSINLEA